MGGVALKFCLRLPIPRFVHSRYGVGLPSFAGIRSVLYSDTPRQWDSIGNNFELEFDRELYEDERVSQLAFNQLAYPRSFRPMNLNRRIIDFNIVRHSANKNSTSLKFYLHSLFIELNPLLVQKKYKH